MLKLENVLAGDAERMLVGNPADWVVRASDPRVVTQSRASAWLKIAEGCDRTCAFCVIPQLRGKQRSRTADDVVAEAERLVAGRSRRAEPDLAGHRRLGARPAGRARGRAGSAAPRRARAPRRRREGRALGAPLLSVPGDDRRRARRAPRAAPARRPVRRHAAAARVGRDAQAHAPRARQGPAAARGRAAAHEASPASRSGPPSSWATPARRRRSSTSSCEFVTWARFEHAVVFRYSDEETCAAHGLDGQGPRAGRRPTGRASSSALQRSIAREKNRALIGRELDVLVEGPSEEHELVMKGRHAGQAPEIDGRRLPQRGRGARRRDAARARRAGQRLGPRGRAGRRIVPATGAATSGVAEGPRLRGRAPLALRGGGVGLELRLGDPGLPPRSNIAGASGGHLPQPPGVSAGLWRPGGPPAVSERCRASRRWRRCRTPG